MRSYPILADDVCMYDLMSKSTYNETLSHLATAPVVDIVLAALNKFPVQTTLSLYS